EYSQAEINVLSDRPFKFASDNTSHQLKMPAQSQFFSIRDLLKAYHKHLGNQFQAQDFTGRSRFQVRIHG
ncbi:MAG: hypothetical protein AAFU33_24810, partial [Bacteroidota bacterium]